MNATAIIDKIKLLPASEQDRVVQFVRTLEKRSPWSGEKLTEYERRMVETDDPAEAERLKAQIIAGFYGDKDDA